MSDRVERGEVTGFHVVDPDLYERHRHEVLQLANSHQRNINEFLPESDRRRAWTDAEIAAHLDLDVRDVNCAFKLVPRRLIQSNVLTSDGALISAELLCGYGELDGLLQRIGGRANLGAR